jgi:hypothetical protein
LYRKSYFHKLYSPQGQMPEWLSDFLSSWLCISFFTSTLNETLIFRIPIKIVTSYHDTVITVTASKEIVIKRYNIVYNNSRQTGSYGILITDKKFKTMPINDCLFIHIWILWSEVQVTIFPQLEFLASILFGRALDFGQYSNI